jgi:hypothetical protein
MQKYKLILGLGLSAKIFAFYNREYNIIGTDNKQMVNSIASNMMFLQANSYNINFLQDLIRISGVDIKYSIKSIDVMTYTKHKFRNTISESEKLDIINKKLTDCNNINNKLAFQKSIFTDNLKLSEEKQALLRIIEVDFNQVEQALSLVIKPQILSGEKITRVDDYVVFAGDDMWAYDKIINTLPYNIFHKLYTGVDCGLITLDTTIVKGTETEFDVEIIPYETAIVYYPEAKYKFSKIIKRNGVCYAEHTGIVENGEVIKNSRLVKTTITDFNNVINLGRFAEWNPDIRIQDVVRFSCDKNIMPEIYQHQKAFSGKYFDFSQDLNLVQDNIKELSLLTNGKIYDLLNTINWKRHKQQHKLDINMVKEEWIGIFRYFLTIGINLGLNYNDLIDAYNKEQRKEDEKKNIEIDW